MDLYLFFSGTGNTFWAVNNIAPILSDDYLIHSIEHKVDFASLIQNANHIIIAYPIYESMIPHIMIDFLIRYKTSFNNKKVSVIITQMLFSGDGAGLAARRLKKYGANIQHTIHINMPNNLTDVSFFPINTDKKIDRKVSKATQKINTVKRQIAQGKIIKDGRRFYSWFLGFFVQRLYAYPIDKRLRAGIKINQDTCIGCEICIHECPTGNLTKIEDLVKANNQCTLCYRCINICPKQSISLFSKRPPRKQYIHRPYN